MRDRDFILLISALLDEKLAREKSLVILKTFESQLDATKCRSWDQVLHSPLCVNPIQRESKAARVI